MNKSITIIALREGYIFNNDINIYAKELEACWSNLKIILKKNFIKIYIKIENNQINISLLLQIYTMRIIIKNDKIIL